MRPWEIQPIVEKEMVWKKWWQKAGHSGIWKKETVEDSPILAKRKGDIIKFPNGSLPGDYRDWFLMKKDIVKHLVPPYGIPKYAMNQYAIIVNRYRVTKIKYRIFRDYGVTIMMLTGEKIGRIRKYYARFPFKVISKYPHKKKKGFFAQLKKPFKLNDRNLFLGKYNLSDSLSEIYSVYGENEKGRNLFLSRLNLIMKSEGLI